MLTFLDNNNFLYEWQIAIVKQKLKFISTSRCHIFVNKTFLCPQKFDSNRCFQLKSFTIESAKSFKIQNLPLNFQSFFKTEFYFALLSNVLENIKD